MWKFLPFFFFNVWILIGIGDPHQEVKRTEYTYNSSLEKEKHFLMRMKERQREKKRDIERQRERSRKGKRERWRNKVRDRRLLRLNYKKKKKGGKSLKSEARAAVDDLRSKLWFMCQQQSSFWHRSSVLVWLLSAWCVMELLCEFSGYLKTAIYASTILFKNDLYMSKSLKSVILGFLKSK